MAFVVKPEVLNVLKLSEIVSMLQMIGSARAELRAFYRQELGLAADPKSGLASIGADFLQKLDLLAEAAESLASSA